MKWKKVGAVTHSNKANNLFFFVFSSRRIYVFPFILVLFWGSGESTTFVFFFFSFLSLSLSSFWILIFNEQFFILMMHDAGAQDCHHEYDAPAPHDVPRSPSPSSFNDGRLDW
jgi:hypothetical protein